MERLNCYYIVFRSFAAAHDYKAHATRMFEIAKKSARRTTQQKNDLVSKSDQYEIDGEDVHAVKSAFALESSTAITLEFEEPFSQSPDSRVIINGAIDYLLQLKHPHRVLLSFSGQPLSKRDLQQYILHQGKTRFMPYSLVDAEDAIIGLIRRSYTNAQEQRNSADHDGQMEIKSGWTLVGDSPEQTSGLWIVSFASDAEAKRFSRAAHQLRVPYKEAGIEVRGPHHPSEGKVTAEVLW